MDVFDRLTALFTRPFREEMDLVDWFLFVGLLIIASILWARVLRAIGVNAT